MIASDDNVIREPARETPVLAETDVLVVGGGVAGVSAAVAAAREGARVVLAERPTYLGGLATGGLIIMLLTMDDGRGQQVIAGLCQETVDRMAARGAAYAPPRDHWGSTEDSLIEHYRGWGLVNGHGPHTVRYSVAYDAEEMKFAFEQMCRDAGVRLLYSVLATDPIRDGDRLRGIVFQGKEGRFAVRAEVVIDTSGDGDVFAGAGCAHEVEEVAPWLWFTMGGVHDVEAAQAAGARCVKTLGAGHVLMPRGAADRISRRIDATKTDDITFAAVECRELVMEEVDRLRREVPGFAEAHLCHIADQLDVTESRRLLGEHLLTREEMDQPCDDVIAVTGHWTKYDSLYHIPYTSLLPRELSNLLVAGRCISVDHRVHHATKEIPACMATGEAAGVAASLALESGGSVKEISVSRVQHRLEAAGAIVRVGRPAPR